eukprot:TRINITY_DN7649_c0_g1_i1.p1 TRINITY_DN7649_c0_g1~~TRINITY_DN7649_c0_g1_i1.p1  ORF type:complete len:1207 (+),score=230.73 TRINITY_DN7649_c0_g1_i1:229-3849(+)
MSEDAYSDQGSDEEFSLSFLGEKRPEKPPQNLNRSQSRSPQNAASSSDGNGGSEKDDDWDEEDDILELDCQDESAELIVDGKFDHKLAGQSLTRSFHQQRFSNIRSSHNGILPTMIRRDLETKDEENEDEENEDEENEDEENEDDTDDEDGGGDDTDDDDHDHDLVQNVPSRIDVKPKTIQKQGKHRGSLDKGRFQDTKSQDEAQQDKEYDNSDSYEETSDLDNDSEDQQASELDSGLNAKVFGQRDNLLRIPTAEFLDEVYNSPEQSPTSSDAEEVPVRLGFQEVLARAFHADAQLHGLGDRHGFKANTIPQNRGDQRDETLEDQSDEDLSLNETQDQMEIPIDVGISPAELLLGLQFALGLNSGMGEYAGPIGFQGVDPQFKPVIDRKFTILEDSDVSDRTSDHDRNRMSGRSSAYSRRDSSLSFGQSSHGSKVSSQIPADIAGDQFPEIDLGHKVYSDGFIVPEQQPKDSSKQAGIIGGINQAHIRDDTTKIKDIRSEISIESPIQTPMSGHDAPLRQLSPIEDMYQPIRQSSSVQEAEKDVEVESSSPTPPHKVPITTDPMVQYDIYEEVRTPVRPTRTPTENRSLPRTGIPPNHPQSACRQKVQNDGRGVGDEKTDTLHTPQHRKKDDFRLNSPQFTPANHRYTPGIATPSKDDDEPPFAPLELDALDSPPSRGPGQSPFFDHIARARDIFNTAQKKEYVSIGTSPIVFQKASESTAQKGADTKMSLQFEEGIFERRAAGSVGSATIESSQEETRDSNTTAASSAVPPPASNSLEVSSISAASSSPQVSTNPEPYKFESNVGPFQANRKVVLEAWSSSRVSRQVPQSKSLPSPPRQNPLEQHYPKISSSFEIDESSKIPQRKSLQFASKDEWCASPPPDRNRTLLYRSSLQRNETRTSPPNIPTKFDRDSVTHQSEGHGRKQIQIEDYLSWNGANHRNPNQKPTLVAHENRFYREQTTDSMEPKVQMQSVGMHAIRTDTNEIHRKYLHQPFIPEPMNELVYSTETEYKRSPELRDFPLYRSIHSPQSEGRVLKDSLLGVTGYMTSTNTYHSQRRLHSNDILSPQRRLSVSPERAIHRSERNLSPWDNHNHSSGLNYSRPTRRQIVGDDLLSTLDAKLSNRFQHRDTRLYQRTLADPPPAFRHESIRAKTIQRPSSVDNSLLRRHQVYAKTDSRTPPYSILYPIDKISTDPTMVDWVRSLRS